MSISSKTTLLAIILLLFVLPAHALAALVYVGGVHGNRAGSTSQGITLSLTALTGGISASAAANDIVIAVVSTGSAANRSIGVSTTGYVRLDKLYANNTGDTNLSVSWKIMGSTPDTSVVTTASGSTADGISATVQVWRNVDTGTPFDVASTTATGTGTGRPTPPPIGPSTTGAIIIASGGGAIAGTGAVYTTATLSNFITDTGADNNDSMTGMGSFAWTSGTYTPAQFGGGTTGSGDSWAGMTVALRPARVPDAPTIGTATAGDAQASVTFTPPASDGGSAITGYTVTSTPGSFTGTGSASPITVTGLANGIAYTFTVHATNAIGDSAESSASNSVTPIGAPTVTTDSAHNFTPTSAKLFGSITATGGENPGTRGFAISTNSTLSSGVSTTSESGSFGTGSFNVSSTTLSSSQTYYFRAWAHNSTGTSTGAILSFTTGNSTPSRLMRLFEGFVIKLISGTIKLFGR